MAGAQGYGAVTWGLRHLGKPGNGLADRMDLGCAKVAIKTGEFYTKHVAKHLDLNSRTMRLTRDASITAAILQVGFLVTIPWLSTTIKVVAGLFGMASVSEAAQEAGWIGKPKPVVEAPVAIKDKLDTIEATLDTIEDKLDTIEADEREFDQVTAEEAAILTEREDWTPEQWKAHNDAVMATEEIDPLEGPKAKLAAARADEQGDARCTGSRDACSRQHSDDRGSEGHQPVQLQRPAVPRRHGEVPLPRGC